MPIKSVRPNKLKKAAQEKPRLIKAAKNMVRYGVHPSTVVEIVEDAVDLAIAEADGDVM